MKSSWVFKKVWHKSLALAVMTAVLFFNGAMAVSEQSGDMRTTTESQVRYECLRGTDVSDQTTTPLLISGAKHDGWILESTENSGRGGLNSLATTLNVGDDGRNRQYRSVLSFKTTSIPDNACVTSAILTLVREKTIVGSNPMKTHGSLLLEILDSAYSNNLALKLTDFSAPTAPGSKAETIPDVGVVNIELSADNLQFISKVGFTQFRMRFATSTDRDRKADYIRFFSGSAKNGAPGLTITYYIPPEIPPAPVLISPLNGATLPVGTVNFAWNPSERADEYWFEWNGTQSGNSGWVSGTNYSVDLGMGVYRWKVKARNLGGESDWSEEWTVNVSSPPTLISPSNGATLPVGAVNFAWNPINGATEYLLEWNGTQSGNSGWISATNYSVDLGMGVYRWRVKARNADIESDWSEEWTVNVSSPPTLDCQPLLPVGMVNFAWNPVNGATEYLLEWSGTTSGDSGWINEPNYSVDLGLGVYSWRVKARNADIESAPSEECTVNVSSPPTLASPTDGATLPVGIIDFDWNPVNGATEYLLEWNGTQSGNSGWISATNYSVDLGMGVYRWRVKARNADIESDWSEEWTVKVSSPPALVSPSDDATVGMDNFVWNPVNGATEYMLKLDGGIPFNSGWIRETKYPMIGGKWKWSVKARNADIESEWSEERDITIVNPPSAPTLVYPKTNEVIGSEDRSTSWKTPWNFQWNTASDATEYYFESKGNSSENSGWISTTNYTASATAGTTWRVKARNIAGESPWSDTWTITGNLFWTNDYPPYTGYLDATVNHEYRINMDNFNITLSVRRTSDDNLNMRLSLYENGQIVAQQGPGDSLIIKWKGVRGFAYKVIIEAISGSGEYELQLIQDKKN